MAREKTLVKRREMGYAARRKASRRLKGCASDACGAEQDDEVAGDVLISTNFSFSIQSHAGHRSKMI